MNKVLSTLLIIAMIVAMGTTSVFAATTNNLIKPSGMIGTVDKDAQDTISSVGGRIMGTIQVVGIVIAVVILMVIGIKYMMGSTEEKAEYKKTMIPYIVGAVLVFAASTIANLAFNIATSIGG